MKSPIPGAVTIAVSLTLLLGAARDTTADPAADRAALLSLHRESLRAHREGNWQWFGEHMGADYVVAFEGEILRPTREETLDQFRHYFSVTSFTTYDDVMEPIIEVSEDGTLGTVIVQVRVIGVSNAQTADETRLDATWTWVNTWRKIDGRWVLRSNVSNMHHGPPARE